MIQVFQRTLLPVQWNNLAEIPKKASPPRVIPAVPRTQAHPVSRTACMLDGT